MDFIIFNICLFAVISITFFVSESTNWFHYSATSFALGLFFALFYILIMVLINAKKK